MPVHEITMPDGSKGYQWGSRGKKYKNRADAERQGEAAYANGYTGDLALDASARSVDIDGRLHIALSHISKAMVCPYYGWEIPDFEKLGLDSDKLYYLLRPPEELQRAAPTFARLPILSKHIPVSSADIQSDLIVGAVGSDVTYNDPYLDADLAIWDDAAIAGIETNTIRELSCAYHYVPQMTAGVFNGEPYDGVMTDILGNHLALVKKGRAGGDVMAADTAISNSSGVNPFIGFLKELPHMVMNKKSKDALTLAILALDSSLDPKKLAVVMDALPESDEPEMVGDKTAKDESEKEQDERVAKDKTAKDESEKEEEEKKEAEDEEEEEKKEKEKVAKDAAIKLAVDSFRAELKSADEARRAVRPTVGDVAMDSAEEVYSFALDTLKVDHKGVSGVPALRALYSVASSKAPSAPRIAQDADFDKKFPDLKRFR